MSAPLFHREPRGPLSESAPVVLSGGPLRCEALLAIAHGAPVVADPAALSALRGWDGAVLQQKRQWLVGAHADQLHSDALPAAFILGHCAGVGDPLPREVVRAAMAARANVLLHGVSGVRPAAVEVLLAMLNAGVHPVVPSQGSVGAAGDLAPMAHIARVAAGLNGVVEGIPAFRPTQKEALALINGVSLTAALAALAVVRAERVLDAALEATAMTFEALRAEPGCIDARALQLRGHPGVAQVGARLAGRLSGSLLVAAGRPADAFSLRCAPQVLGAAADAIASARAVVEAELGGVSDNPLCFWGEGPTPEVVEAGNFHGASLGLCMDHLKVALTQLATISERRTFRLTYGQLSSDLPSFLVAGTGLNSGFMLAQYTAASLASECKGLAHPASVDSIPTVQHHEDHVSMGPIAARGALEVVECVADIVGIEALLAAQALDLRLSGAGEAPHGPLAPGVEALRARVRAVVRYWEDDGVLHPELSAVGRLVRAGALGIEAPAPGAPATLPW